MVNYFAVGDLLEMRGRAIEGRCERMQQHRRRFVSICAATAICVRKVASRELLDQNLVGCHLRIEGGDPGAQHILYIGVDLGLDTFRPEVVAGEVFALPLPMHHLQALGVLEAVLGIDPVGWKFLKKIQV